MARPGGKTMAELESELLDLEIMVTDMNWRRRRREAWPKAWGKIEDVFPTTPPKTSLTLRLDADMAAWFRAQGRGYQTRMNAVLRAYMLARKTKLDCAG
jgi:uncharacterized protein (DUF4415 family)